jgi:hypothetical protein
VALFGLSDEIDSSLSSPSLQDLQSTTYSLSKFIAMLAVGDMGQFGSPVGVNPGIVGTFHQAVRRNDTDTDAGKWSKMSPNLALNLSSLGLAAFAGMMFGMFCPACLLAMPAICSYISNSFLQRAE